MPRIRFWAIAALAGLALPGTPALSQPANAAKPVVAIMNFTNGSLQDHATYEPFSVAVAAMLISELRGNQSIVLVDRERLRQVLDEHALAKSGQVDAATAAAAGKVLGAHHMIFGVFFIDRRGHLRIDARAVNVETGAVEHVESVSDDADNLLRAVEKLGQQLSMGLRLPGRTVTPAKGSGPSEAKKGQVLANLKYARALQEEDRKNPAKALQLYREFLAESPKEYMPLQRQEAETRIKVLAGSL